MPRMQVYLPDDLYRELKDRGLPASELLQRAVRTELQRQKAEAETDTYLADLREELGDPTPAHRKRAETIVRRVATRRSSRAG